MLEMQRRLISILRNPPSQLSQLLPRWTHEEQTDRTTLAGVLVEFVRIIRSGKLLGTKKKQMLATGRRTSEASLKAVEPL